MERETYEERMRRGREKWLEEGRKRWKQENIERLQRERAAARAEKERLDRLASEYKRKEEEAVAKFRARIAEQRRKKDEEEARAKVQLLREKYREEMESKLRQEELPMDVKQGIELTKIQEKGVSMANEIMPENLAKIFFESGIFKDVKSVAQATVKIIAGKEMGLTPIQSMTNIFILDNKVGYEAKVFLSKVKKSGKYDYSFNFIDGKDGKLESCEVTFYSIMDGERTIIGSSSFSVYDAAKLGLINKMNYKNYLDLMLFYRAAMKGIKMCCPDILDGAAIREEYQEIISEGNEEEKVEEVSLEGIDNE